MKLQPQRFSAYVVSGLVAFLFTSSRVCAEDQNLWPFQVGNTWTLKTELNGKVDTDVLTVMAIITGKDSSTATVEYRSGTLSLQKETYRFNSHGISRLSSGVNGGSRIYPGLPIIQYPLTAGATWYWNGTITTKGRQVAAAAKMTASGLQDISLPAGKFQAYKVHVNLEVVAGKSKVVSPNDYWFVPGVGLVRQTATIGKATIDSTLTEYKLQQTASHP